MAAAILLLFLFAFIVVLASGILLIMPSRRQSAKRWLIISGATCVMAIGPFFYFMLKEIDVHAQSMGFASDQDYKAATEAGFSTADAWNVNKENEAEEIRVADEARLIELAEQRKIEVAAESKAAEEIRVADEARIVELAKQRSKADAEQVAAPVATTAPEVKHQAPAPKLTNERSSSERTSPSTVLSNVRALCAIFDATGLTSAKCEVSGWNSAITVSIDMSSSEARGLCSKLNGLMRDEGRSFNDWTLKIVSPYSTGSIAVCALPQ